MDALATWFDDPGCEGMILTGPSGVGKTALAQAVVRRIQQDGRRFVVRIVASEALRTVPFGALAHLMPGDTLQEGGTVDPVAIFAGIRDIATSVGRGPIITLVDDLPMLDEATQSVAAQLHAAGLAFLVATMRAGARLPAGQLCLERSFGVRRVTVEPLGRIDVERAVAGVLGGPLDSASLDQVWALSQGNPLFLRELLLSAGQRGALRRSPGGIWRLADLAEARSVVADVIGSRLDALDDSALAALQLLAVAGQLPLSDLERAGHLDDIETLERLALVAIDTDAADHEVQVAHPLHAEAVRLRLGAIGQRKVLRRAIDLVQGRATHRLTDSARLAGWHLDTGAVPDVETLVQGTRLARSANDFTSAVRLARAALEQTGSVEMRRVLVEALSMTGQAEQAEAVAAVDVAAAPDDEDERMQLVAARLYNLVWNLQDQPKARSVIDAERARFSGQAMQDLLTLRHATVLSFEDRCRDALAELEARDGWSDGIRAVALAGIAQLRLITGRAEQALVAAEAALALTGPDPATIPAQADISHANALAACGRLTDAIGALATARQRTTAATMHRAAMAVAYGDLLAQHGRLDQARTAFAEAVVLSEAVDNHTIRAMALGSLAAVMGQRGDVQAAAGLLAEVDDNELPFRTGSDERARGMGWALVATGRPAQAREVVIETAAACQAAGEHWDALRLWVDAARMDGAKEVVARATACAAECEGPVAPVLAAFIAAVATGSAEALADAAGRLADLGHQLVAAEAWARAAVAYRSEGDPRGSSAAMARATVLARRCEGAVTVDRLTTSLEGAVTPLSAREREIALLAAEGLGSQEIADRLVVSVRTVSNHLQNVYVKLGVNRRSDLRDALG